MNVENSYSAGIGYYKVILQLVGVLSFGKIAKRITDLAIDRMQGERKVKSAIIFVDCSRTDVQNLRKTIYGYVIPFW